MACEMMKLSIRELHLYPIDGQALYLVSIIRGSSFEPPVQAKWYSINQCDETAMLPGSTIIKKCSACTGLIKKYTITSGNTFGAIFWTDGKMDAPMLPDSPKLVKCPHCGSLIWIDQLETVEEVSAFELGSTNARDPGKPNLDDYASFLSNNRLLQPDVEKDVRVRAWWRGNDERRRDQQSTFTEIEIQNLNALTVLLDQSIDYERLMQAEIKRERGDFEHALELLDQPFDEQLGDAAIFIRDLVLQGDQVVAPIHADME